MRETYEKLCELFGVEPEESEFNSDWLDHYEELKETKSITERETVSQALTVSIERLTLSH